MNFKPALIAAASVLSISAHASTTVWGVHDLLELGVSVTPSGLFSDDYLFTLSLPNKLFSTAVVNNLTQVLDIENGVVTLYKEAGAVDTLMGSYAFTATSGNLSYSFGAMTSGDYYYLVTGQGTGTQGGFYTISSTVTPVPEPESYAMMLGGLGAVAFLARRRRR